MKDITLVSSLPALPTPRQEGAGISGTGFAQALGEAIQSVNRQQVEADLAVGKVQTGQTANLHETMIALEKADISLRLTVQMRNKVIEAYHEIMRMQV